MTESRQADAAFRHGQKATLLALDEALAAPDEAPAILDQAILFTAHHALSFDRPHRLRGGQWFATANVVFTGLRMCMVTDSGDTDPAGLDAARAGVTRSLSLPVAHAVDEAALQKNLSSYVQALAVMLPPHSPHLRELLGAALSVATLVLGPEGARDRIQRWHVLSLLHPWS